MQKSPSPQQDAMGYYHNPKSYLKSRRLANSENRRMKVIESVDHMMFNKILRPDAPRSRDGCEVVESVEHVKFNTLLKTGSTRERGECPRDDDTVTTREPSSSNTLATICDGQMYTPQDENCINAKWVWQSGDDCDDDEKTWGLCIRVDEQSQE
eukprot:scaffold2200_cov112-Cylindrotheca_fusiformis.AAC.7